jgi:hypothetical protein
MGLPNDDTSTNDSVIPPTLVFGADLMAIAEIKGCFESRNLDKPTRERVLRFLCECEGLGEGDDWRWPKYNEDNYRENRLRWDGVAP